MHKILTKVAKLLNRYPRVITGFAIAIVTPLAIANAPLSAQANTVLTLSWAGLVFFFIHKTAAKNECCTTE